MSVADPQQSEIEVTMVRREGLVACNAGEAPMLDLAMHALSRSRLWHGCTCRRGSMAPRASGGRPLEPRLRQLARHSR